MSSAKSQGTGHGGATAVMTLNDAFNAVIDDGIEAARADYIKPSRGL
jgi:hypothetical protein